MIIRLEGGPFDGEVRTINSYQANQEVLLVPVLPTNLLWGEVEKARMDEPIRTCRYRRGQTIRTSGGYEQVWQYEE